MNILQVVSNLAFKIRHKYIRVALLSIILKTRQETLKTGNNLCFVNSHLISFVVRFESNFLKGFSEMKRLFLLLQIGDFFVRQGSEKK